MKLTSAMLAAVVLLAAATACGGSAKTGAAHRATATWTAGSASQPHSAASPSPGAQAGAVRPAAPAQAAAGAPTPGALHLPAPGSYKAEVTQSGSTTAVTQGVAVRTGAGDPEVTTTTTKPDGSQIITYQVWRSNGMYLKQISYVSSGNRTDCVFQTPVLELLLPLRMGARWTASSSCTTGGATPSTTKLSLSGGVAATAWQVIGGARVATYEIKSQLTTEITGTYTGQIGAAPQPYDVKTSSALTDYLDPPAGMLVHDVNESTSTINGTPSSSSTDTILASLKPS